MSGGTPPESLEEFDGWVRRRLLNPASAMFREGLLLLREEPVIADPTSYAAVLTAVSGGAHRRTEIAAALGRPAGAIAHLLTGLEGIGLLERTDEALCARRSVFHVAEPVVRRLYQLLIQRAEPRLVAGRAERVWAAAADSVAAKIYGPHFEDLARRWCMDHASEASLGGPADRVQPTTLPCRAHRQGHELDVVVFTSEAFDSGRIAAIGEAKCTEKPVDEHHLERLEHLRTLLPADRVQEEPRLLLFSRTGFSKALHRTAASRADVELVDLDRLYNGS